MAKPRAIRATHKRRVERAASLAVAQLEAHAPVLLRMVKRVTIGIQPNEGRELLALAQLCGLIWRNERGSYRTANQMVEDAQQKRAELVKQQAQDEVTTATAAIEAAYAAQVAAFAAGGYSVKATTAANGCLRAVADAAIAQATSAATGAARGGANRVLNRVSNTIMSNKDDVLSTKLTDLRQAIAAEGARLGIRI